MPACLLRLGVEFENNKRVDFTMSEYEKQAIDFLKKCHAVMTIKREKIVDRFPGDEKAIGETSPRRFSATWRKLS